MGKPKWRKVLLWSTATVLVLIAGIAYVVAKGGQPLEDGATMANGKVTVVVDEFIAAYIVSLDSDEVLLVDATLDTGAAALLTALGAMGKSAADVQAILLTHGHGDHIAGALAFPDADIYALRADVDLVEGRRVAKSMAGRAREPRRTGITVTNVLADGDIVTIGGTKIEVFSVPGHTLGSAAYLVHGVLFLGDSAAARSDDKISGAPPYFSADRKQNAVSLKSLAARLKDRASEIDTLAFGHQGHLDTIEPLLTWADSH